MRLLHCVMLTKGLCYTIEYCYSIEKYNSCEANGMTPVKTNSMCSVTLQQLCFYNTREAVVYNENSGMQGHAYLFHKPSEEKIYTGNLEPRNQVLMYSV